MYGDVDEEKVVSEANILVSETSKLSAGARIFRGPQGPEILVFHILHIFSFSSLLNKPDTSMTTFKCI